MIERRLPVLLFTGIALLGAAPPCDAQVGKVLRQAKERVEQAKEHIADARSLRCDVQGVCGQVTQSELFAPESYESLAVTVFDGTSRYGSPGAQGIVRDAFEKSLVEKGFLLAASSDANAVREMIARNDGAWSDEDLKQLGDFVNGIDAVLVVDIRQLDLGSCNAGRSSGAGSEATVHLSARWLNVDAGDIPWVATHKATICEANRAATVPTEALKTAASQLATALPERNGSR